MNKEIMDKFLVMRQNGASVQEIVDASVMCALQARFPSATIKSKMKETMTAFGCDGKTAMTIMFLSWTLSYTDADLLAKTLIDREDVEQMRDA